MNLQHLNVKFFVEGSPQVDLGEFIDVFHRWVAAQSMDELLIDVADYRHVPAGPGVVLVGLDADYAIDQADGRDGLLYNRKAPIEGTPSERIAQAVSAASAACRLLEGELSNLKFDMERCEISINDRALAPNSPDTFAKFEPLLAEFIRDVAGQEDFDIQYDERDPRRRFTVAVKLSQPLETVST